MLNAMEILPASAGKEARRSAPLREGRQLGVTRRGKMSKRSGDGGKVRGTNQQGP